MYRNLFLQMALRLFCLLIKPRQTDEETKAEQKLKKEHVAFVLIVQIVQIEERENTFVVTVGHLIGRAHGIHIFCYRPRFIFVDFA